MVAASESVPLDNGISLPPHYGGVGVMQAHEGQKFVSDAGQMMSYSGWSFSSLDHPDVTYLASARTILLKWVWFE